MHARQNFYEGGEVSPKQEQKEIRETKAITFEACNPLKSQDQIRLAFLCFLGGARNRPPQHVEQRITCGSTIAFIKHTCSCPHKDNQDQMQLDHLQARVLLNSSLILNTPNFRGAYKRVQKNQNHLTCCSNACGCLFSLSPNQSINLSLSLFLLSLSLFLLISQSLSLSLSSLSPLSLSLSVPPSPFFFLISTFVVFPLSFSCRSIAPLASNFLRRQVQWSCFSLSLSLSLSQSLCLVLTSL